MACALAAAGCEYFNAPLAPFIEKNTATVSANAITIGDQLGSVRFVEYPSPALGADSLFSVALNNPQQFNIQVAVISAFKNDSAADNVSVASWTKDQAVVKIAGVGQDELYRIALRVTSKDGVASGERVFDMKLSPILFHTPVKVSIPGMATDAVMTNPEAHWYMQNSAQHEGITKVVIDFKYFDTSTASKETRTYDWDETALELRDANGVAAGFLALPAGTPSEPALACKISFPSNNWQYTFKITVYDKFGLSAEAKSSGFDSDYGAYEAKIGDTVYATLAGAVNAATGSAGTPDTITVLRDITHTGTPTSTLTISGSKHIKLTVPQNASKTVKLGSGHTGDMFKVASGSSLTFEGNGTGVLTVDGNKGFVDLGGSSLVYVNGGALYLHAGAVLQNAKKTANSGPIYVGSSGTFTMTGGTITGMEVGRGGGVYLNSGIFNMYGGEISRNTGTNTSDSGAGVFLQGGTMTMTGGKINNNTAYGRSGGVHVTGNSVIFTMSGGEISGNIAGSGGSAGSGGGVHLAGNVPGSTFTMSGTAKITGNQSAYNGGGVNIDLGTFTMTGGEISGNTANNGPGIRARNCTFNMSGAAFINSNNIVLLETNAVITITDNLTGTTAAVIKPSTTTPGTQVLTNNSFTAANYQKFALDSSVTGRSIAGDGTLQ